MKRTKTKLVSSIVTLLICFAMLIGSTFAWFTDSASTGVNKIQAGNLDVVLEMNNGTAENPSWVNAEGKTLTFKTPDNRAADKILWEPGCTYELPELRIVNKGNLNLKYKIEITGIQGDAKLNEVIEWTINDAAINLTEEHLPAGQTGTAFTIKGHMQETAGNEYKNLTIDGISITVYATQDTGEYDSFGNSYDAGAKYVKKTATIMDETDGKTYTLESGKTYPVGYATVTVADNGDITYTNTGAGQTVSITTDGHRLTVYAPNDTVNHYGESEYVVVNAIAGNSFHEFGKVGILSVESGRVVAENGNNIDVIQVKGDSAVVAVPENKILDTKLEKEGNISITLKVINSTGAEVASKITEDGTVEGSIPEELKEVLVNTGSSSTPTINDAKDYVARVGNNYYATLQEAIDACEANSTVALLKDITGDRISVTKSLSIDGNGYTLTDDKSNGRAIWIDATDIALTINDLTIDGANKCERGLQVNQLNSGEWNYSHVILNTCEIKNITYYAINLNTKTTVTMEINNSYISGWAAINAYGTGNEIEINNSVLEGINDKGYDAEGWNDFATICLEGDTTGQSTIGSSDYNVTINNSKIIAKQTTGNKQRAIGFNSNSKKSTVSLNNTEIVLGDEELCSFAYDNGTGNKIYINNELVHESLEANCWYSNGVFNADKKGGMFTNLASPFDGEWMADGEGIILEKDIVLEGNITCRMSEGSFYLYLDGYSISGGKILLEPGVSVISDTSGISEIFGGGTTISVTNNSDDTFTYTCN